MSRLFKRIFDFPLEHSSHTISIEAIVQLHHSDPYYVIDSFHFSKDKRPATGVSILPPQEIKYLKEHGQDVWVHKDSERASQLSLSIGKAIEESGYFQEK
jgi:hypothetical protein